MNLFQTTDHHLRNEDPFFIAGVALDDWLLKFFRDQTEPFCYLDSGDRFHTSKETGRVNGEVVRFFMDLEAMENCRAVYVLQGNHDFKSDTGSALDILSSLSTKLHLINEPQFLKLPEQKGLTYFLPHIRAKTYPNFYGKESYGKEGFHRELWESRGSSWDELKPQIEFLSAHFADETCGELLQDADLSFIPCTKSNGHIHKFVSKNHLVSAAITRRDEIDKKCMMRKFNTKDFSTLEEIDLPVFLNYAKIQYGQSLEDYFSDKKHVKPVASLIVDVYGHDNEDFVREEYQEKFKDLKNPAIYIGDVVSEERMLKLDEELEREDLDIDGADIKDLFIQFCNEKSVSASVKDSILKRIGA